MLGYLILLFTVVPVVELALLIQAGQHIGLFNTIAIVLFTGIAGAVLAKQQGLNVLVKIKDDVNQGKMPTETLFDGVIILCSGILLLTPGFTTDILGLLGLLPPTRSIMKVFIKRKLEKMVRDGSVISINRFR